VSRFGEEGTWAGDRVRREVFFFAGAGARLHGSLYAAAGPGTARQGLVMCPSWGVEADRSDRLVHALALAMAELGGAALVFHYPGYGDSEGDLEGMTTGTLAEAATAAAAEARARQPAERWVLGGFGYGAAVACMAAAGASADALLLVQPALRPGAYFAELERKARRVTLGSGGSETVAFGYPLPRAILERGADEDAVVATALEEFAGRTAVVRHESPAPDVQLPAGADVVTAPGTWQFGSKDHPELVQGATRWLERAVSEAAAR
jgi:alpha/beta superfamily hydrolase